MAKFITVTKHRIEPEAGPGFADFNVCSWNANGLRARIQKNELGFLFNKDGVAKYDVVCIQETKADEVQVEPQPNDKKKALVKKLPNSVISAYPYRFYKSTRLRKGLNGTAVWSRIRPVRELDPPITDVEGRVTTVEFPSFIAVALYVPNSGTKHTYRTGLWHAVHTRYLDYLQGLKPTVVCADSNVCHLSIDIHNPRKYRDAVAGFLNIEREQFGSYLELGYHDSFRTIYPARTKAYTWYNLRGPKGVPTMRERGLGWRLDHILIGGIGTTEEAKKIVVKSEIRNDVYGSDHLPLSSVLRLPTNLAPTNPKSVFPIDWLKPWTAFLKLLGAKCQITALSRHMLLKHWAKIAKEEDNEEERAEQDMGLKEEGEGEPLSVLPYATLFSFAMSNMDTRESEVKQSQTKNFFTHGEFTVTSSNNSEETKKKRAKKEQLLVETIEIDDDDVKLAE